MTPLWGTVAILAALGLLMAGVRGLQADDRISPEIARKTVHVGMGVISFPLPWIFPDPRPIWLVAILVVFLFLAVRAVPALADRIGGVLGGVSRVSLGEIYYPLGAAIAFSQAHRTPVVFCVAMSVLAFGDTAGAVVGTRWGRWRYAMPGGIKSVEGSLAMLVISIACVSGALVAWDNEAWKAALAGGFFVGIIAMIVEAVSCRGLDNLFLPVVVVGLIELWIAQAERQRWIIVSLVLAVALFFVLAVVANAVARRRGDAGRIWSHGDSPADNS